MPEHLLTRTEAAQILGLKPATIRAWTHQGRLPYVRLSSRAIRYKLSDLERLIREGERPAFRAVDAAPRVHSLEKGDR